MWLAGRWWSVARGLLLLCLVSGRGAGVTVDLMITPQRIPADGVSVATISATVREGSALAQTPQSVLITTTAGDLLPMGGGPTNGQQMLVQTQGGRAQAQLRATTYETSALVMASVMGQGGATAQRSITFGLRAAEAVQLENIIKVSGAYLVYHPQGSLQTIEALGNAAVSYQGIEIRAPRLQLYVGEEMVVARDFQGRVSIGLGPPPYKTQADQTGPPYFGDALLFDLRSFNGAMFSTQTGLTQQFSSRALTPAPATELPPDAYDFVDLSGSEQLQIRARQAVIYPHEKIRFDQPQFYVAGRRIMSLPYYFEPLGYNAGAMGGAGGFSQYINYSSRDGLLVNFPYYFNMSDLSTNELTLARGQRMGTFSRQSGWQVYYHHHTDLPNQAGEFDFEVDHIGPDFGLSFTRSQRFGTNSIVSFDLAWPEHRNFYASGNLYSKLGPGSVSVTANLDNLTGLGGGVFHNTNAVWQSNSLRVAPIGSRFALSVGFGYSHMPRGYDLWRQSLSLSWDHDPWRIGKHGMLIPYAGLRFQNTVNSGHETSFTSNLSYRQDLSAGMSLGLNYTFDTNWSTLYQRPDRHVLSLDWQLARDKYRGYAYGSYSVLDKALSASLLFDYSLSRNYGLQAQTVFQSGDYGSFHETELWAYRMLGGRELRLRYNIEQSKLYFEIDNQF